MRRRKERKKERRDTKMEDASGTCKEEGSEEKMRRGGVTGEIEREKRERKKIQ
jgi:hypothetical protein